MLRALLFAAWAGAGFGLGAASAQQFELGSVVSPVLVIDSDRLYRASQFGQSIEKDLRARRAALAAEQREIEAELSAEEQDLTEQRKSMTPEEFRPLAEAFDARVQEIRRIRTAKISELEEELSAERERFGQAAQPVLEQIMIESGAAVILERRVTFFSASSVDITAEAISRLDAVLGGSE